MDLRSLEYFTVAAELEHIGKAAERLRISQSPLSRQIRQLESELNLELFVRERQRVHLTESGKWLLGEARNLLAHADKMASEARQRAAGKAGTISVGFVSAAMWSGVLPPLLRRFKAELPGAVVSLRNMNSTSQIEAVEAGSLDIGFVALVPESPAIETVSFSEVSLSLVIPAGNALARKRSIAPAILRTNSGSSCLLRLHRERTRISSPNAH